MVQSIDRTLDILELLAGTGDDLSLSQMRARLGLPLGTLHRLLATLVRRGYAAQDGETRRYGPGPKLLEIASHATSNSRFNLWRIAKVQLHDLMIATGETSNLAAPQDGHAVYIDQAPGPRLMRMFTEVGHRAPFYCSGTGKALLSGFTPQQLEAYLASARLTPWTPRTITSPEALRLEVARTRERGFALDDEEREEGVRCVAAPIFDRAGACVAALSISGPTTRLSRERANELGPRVRAAADECSAQLGYRAAAAPVGAGVQADESG